METGKLDVKFAFLRIVNLIALDGVCSPARSAFQPPVGGAGKGMGPEGGGGGPPAPNIGGGGGGPPIPGIGGGGGPTPGIGGGGGPIPGIGVGGGPAIAGIGGGGGPAILGIGGGEGPAIPGIGGGGGPPIPGIGGGGGTDTAGVGGGGEASVSGSEGGWGAVTVTGGGRIPSPDGGVFWGGPAPADGCAPVSVGVGAVCAPTPGGATDLVIDGSVSDFVPIGAWGGGGAGGAPGGCGGWAGVGEVASDGVVTVPVDAVSRPASSSIGEVPVCTTFASPSVWVDAETSLPKSDARGLVGTASVSSIRRSGTNSSTRGTMVRSSDGDRKSARAFPVRCWTD